MRLSHPVCKCYNFPASLILQFLRGLSQGWDGVGALASAPAQLRGRANHGDISPPSESRRKCRQMGGRGAACRALQPRGAVCDLLAEPSGLEL